MIFPLYCTFLACRIPLWYFSNHDKLFAFCMKLNSEQMCIQNLRISNAILNEPKTTTPFLLSKGAIWSFFAISKQALSVDLDPLYLEN